MNQLVKNLAKCPYALTAYILVSVLVFVQFIGLFCGRWIDLADWSVNIFLVVIVWILFAKAVNKNKPIGSGIVTCFFVWSICKLVVLGLSVFMILISAIYMLAKNGDFENASLAIGGVILLLFGVGIYVFRILTNILLMKEIGLMKKGKQAFRAKPNWSVLLIVAASLRGAGLFLQYIISAIARGDMLDVAVGYGYSAYGGYYNEPSWFATQICRALGTGSNVTLTIVDLLYVAILIMLIMIYKKYKVNTGNKGK